MCCSATMCSVSRKVETLQCVDGCSSVARRMEPLDRIRVSVA